VIALLYRSTLSLYSIALLYRSIESISHSLARVRSLVCVRPSFRPSVNPSGVRPSVNPLGRAPYRNR